MLPGAMLLVIAAALISSPQPARAQGNMSNYAQFEAQRRDAIGLQLGIQEDLRATSGLSSRLYPGLRPYSLDAIYAGLATPAGARSWGSPYVFEPWPFVPGDIYGRQFDFGQQTPLGHVTTYTGPNSYIYEPFYADPIAPPAPAPRPVPTGPPLEQSPLPIAPVSPAPGVYGPEELPPPMESQLREF
jgi:hypothetical protein